MTVWKAIITLASLAGPVLLLGDPLHLKPAAAPAAPQIPAPAPAPAAATAPAPAVTPAAAAVPPAVPAPAASPAPVLDIPAAVLAAPTANPAPEVAVDPAPAVLDAQPLPHPEIATPLPQVSSPSAAGISSLPSMDATGYWVDNAPLNEVFQYLARKARLQYFYNTEINGPQFILTGHLELDNPLRQMEEIAVAYGLSLYQQGSTAYMMNEMQLARLPVEIMSYQLKYLRGSPLSRSGASAGGDASGSGGTDQQDFEKLKSIMRPLLTKNVGQIEFEEKTNTLLITDNTVKLRRVRELLEKLDRPKQQIAVNVRVLRVTNTRGKKLGVDWRTSLGDGITISAEQSLNAMFNLPDTSTLAKASSVAREVTNSFENITTAAGVVGVPGASNFDNTSTSQGFKTTSSSSEHNSTYQDGPGLVFDAMQVQAIVHALEQNGIVSQESCPTIITEDNEQGIISIVDRFPIVTTNVSQTDAGQTITDEVRYKVDKDDPDAMEEPDKSREIGVTLTVTPTMLPDGTVRMKLRPRVAKIVELVQGNNGNVYPRVSESTADAISRIPAGQSLILGGFYDYSNSNNKNKVPVLGNVPVLKHLFRYKEKTMEKVSLVFIITPNAYDAGNVQSIQRVNEEVRAYSGMERHQLEQMSQRLEPAWLVPMGGGPSGKSPAGPSSSLPSEGGDISPQPQGAPQSQPWLKRIFSREERRPITSSSHRP
ncbi:secretin N-terminal domain-containing protein [Verrucomicrobium sp. BvORR106]|uniref:type II secretion system protein GspD n=1 Tax=Verrucomicrobium sp. BvORR106 TaxID=1403819 RepID=UPI000570D33A|nr:secretin N-terminal domain-containing protein [Verrucomicrobium sp. BvORR106]